MRDPAAMWAAATLVLVAVWLLQRFPVFKGRRGLVLAVVLAVVVVFGPWFGPALPFWSASLSANLSVVMLLLLVLSIVRCAFRIELFRPRDWRAAWMFGAAAAIFLYPSSLGLGWRSFDSYSLGWPWLDWGASFCLFAAAAATAGVLVVKGNRFGWLLVPAAALYALRVQESQNFWDYLVDPLYAAFSLLACLFLLYRGVVRRFRR